MKTRQKRHGLAKVTLRINPAGVVLMSFPHISPKGLAYGLLTLPTAIELSLTVREKAGRRTSRLDTSMLVETNLMAHREALRSLYPDLLLLVACQQLLSTHAT